jgi:carbon monoxide dehydrogenase subunit G
MELEHSFVIPVPPEQAWGVLLDVEKVAPCMPGATVDSVDGDDVKGRMKIKVGPVALTYAGTARFTEKDEQARKVVLEASGKETRGSGTAAATITSTLSDEGGQTRVVVHTTMTVTGRPAQFGRGVMAEVGGRVIEKFATNLAAQLSGGAAAPAASAPAAAAATSTSTERQSATAAASSPAPDQAAADQASADQAPEDQAKVPIEELNLPVRSYNSLRREGVATVGSLTALSEQDLLAIDGLGPASVKEIRQRLADRGLSLGTAAGSNGGSSAAAASAAAPVSAGAATQAAPVAGPGPVAGAAADRDLAAANGLLPPQGARPPDEDALDLLSVAGLPVLKRVLPAIGVALFGAVLFGLLRRRRRRARG